MRSPRIDERGNEQHRLNKVVEDLKGADLRGGAHQVLLRRVKCSACLTTQAQARRVKRREPRSGTERALRRWLQRNIR